MSTSGIDCRLDHADTLDDGRSGWKLNDWCFCFPALRRVTGMRRKFLGRAPSHFGGNQGIDEKL